MSTPGRRGPTTRAASRATSSRAASEETSVAGDAPANLRPSRAGSAKGKRSDVGSRDNKTYGSKLAAAGAERMAAAAKIGAVGDIEAALNEAQPEIEGAPGRSRDQQLAPVQEEVSEHSSVRYPRIRSRERPQVIEQTFDEEESLIDQALEAASRATDRPLSSFLHWKHYLALAAFATMLVLLFADIYRGPLLGARFDLLRARFAPVNQTAVVQPDLSSIHSRLAALELQVRNQPTDTSKMDWSSQINFFSYVHDVQVIQPLTSPTGVRWMRRNDYTLTTQKPSFLDRWTYRYLELPRTANSQSTVFGPWDEEHGPSWCGAAGEAKLQLATLVQGPMTPTELVVEYNPRAHEVNPGKVPAPKEIELWMQVSDDDTRERIGRDIQALLGDFSMTSGAHAKPALPKDFVPIGRWTYDFYSPRHVQTFGVPIELRGAQTHKLAVRVNSNWAGEPFTCLYRLRLHGVSHHRDAGV